MFRSNKSAKNTNSDNQKEDDTKEIETGKAPIVIKNNSLETFSEKENRIKATKKLAIILAKRNIRLNQLSEDEIEKHFVDHALTNIIYVRFLRRSVGGVV